MIVKPPVIVSVVMLFCLMFPGCRLDSPSDDGPDRTVDVAVVGSGIAGSMAALSAKEAGATVLLIEKRPLFGGTSRLAAGNFAVAVVNAKNNPEDSLATWKNFMAGSTEVTGFPNYDKFLSVAVLAAEAVGYLESLLGSKIIGKVEGGGSVLMKTLEENLAAQHIEVLLNCEATNLLVDKGAVTGIRAAYKRKPFRIAAKNVILATGGFSRNPDLVTQWAGTKAGLSYVVSLADSGSVGDGILMAQEAGAALYNSTFTCLAGLQFSQTLRTISVFSQASLFTAAAAPLDTQILINHDAMRCMNEAVGGSFGNVSSANFNAAYAMVRDAKPPYYIIYDANNPTTVTGGLVMDITTPALETGAALQNGEVVRAETLEELALGMEVNAAALIQTVTRYNSFSGAADADFGKAGKYLKRIETGPFYGVKVYPNTYGSMGGVLTDSTGRVLTAEGKVIPGLYAAGEVSNRDFFNQFWPGGASLALYSTVGRLAGKAAAEN